MKLISIALASTLFISLNSMAATPMPATAMKNGCQACHSVEEEPGRIGPAWIKVSQKYKADPKAEEYLNKKVAGGSRGVWGDAGKSFMMPTEGHLSAEDRQELVKFILSLAK